MSDKPTEAERHAFVWMQARMVELLLRHHPAHFDKTFAEHPELDPETSDDPTLERLRRLAVLFYLRQELFGSILPRIKRRLSFEAPRETQREALPPRGRIHWPRTLSASWQSLPGEPPLEVVTRQRRRHFATPENLLTVVTLVEYRAATQRWLDEEATQESAMALRHPLNEIVEACEREMAFPQFAGLRAEAERIAHGHAEPTPDALEHAVAATLQPGRNSAYDDLLAWRRRLHTLRLLDRTQQLAPQPMLGADPARDNYLYQLWLFYELGDFLQRAGRLAEWQYVEQCLTFTWGDGTDERTYFLQHDQAILNAEDKVWEGPFKGSGARPDLYVRHTEPYEVRGNEGLIWRELGVVLDAKYYRPRSNKQDEKAPNAPFKRMMADLLLTGEEEGVLIFAFHGAHGKSTDKQAHLHPILRRAQLISPGMRVDVRQIEPEPSEPSAQDERFAALLNRVHQHLRVRRVPHCYGFFLDELSVNGHGTLADVTGLRARTGSALNAPLTELLVCPKPHVGAWRVDLVTHAQCCKDATVCHIMGQPDIQPPTRLVRLEQIEQAIRAVHLPGTDRGETERLDQEEAVVKAATRQVLVVARRYADLVQPRLSDYRTKIRERLDIGELFDTTPLLSDEERDTLALGRFLWEQIEHIRADNFAGPTLLFTGVLEEVARRTIYKQSGPLYTNEGQKLHDTLGTLGNSTGHGGSNWLILERVVVQASHWHTQGTAQPVPDFRSWIEQVRKLSFIRNKAAHQADVSHSQFEKLCRLVFGSATHGVGTLNGLLLAWRDGSGDANPL